MGVRVLPAGEIAFVDEFPQPASASAAASKAIEADGSTQERRVVFAEILIAI